LLTYPEADLTYYF